MGAGVWVWRPNTVPLACTPCGGCVPRGWLGGRSRGGWPATVLRGVWCQALSLPLPPVLWSGQPGFRDPCVPVGVGAGMGVPFTVARGIWGQALPLPRLPAYWAGCWGQLPTCCGRGRVGVGARNCPLGLHALWGLRAAGVVGGRPPTMLGAVRPPWGGSVAFVCRGAGFGGGGAACAPCPPFVRPGGGL